MAKIKKVKPENDAKLASFFLFHSDGRTFGRTLPKKHFSTLLMVAKK